MDPSAGFRDPTDAERALLERLLEAEFPGKHDLVPLVRSILVKTIDNDGGLELRSQVGGRAPVLKRIPVEAQAKDIDGVVVHTLLHIFDGRPVELEIYREDGTQVKEMPPPSTFELIVLPPMPKKVMP